MSGLRAETEGNPYEAGFLFAQQGRLGVRLRSEREAAPRTESKLVRGRFSLEAMLKCGPGRAAPQTFPDLQCIPPIPTVAVLRVRNVINGDDVEGAELPASSDMGLARTRFAPNLTATGSVGQGPVGTRGPIAGKVPGEGEGGAAGGQRRIPGRA